MDFPRVLATSFASLFVRLEQLARDVVTAGDYRRQREMVNPCVYAADQTVSFGLRGSQAS